MVVCKMLSASLTLRKLGSFVAVGFFILVSHYVSAKQETSVFCHVAVSFNICISTSAIK